MVPLGGHHLDAGTRALDRDTPLGTMAGWISSGVPVSQPEPDALAPELLAARGLRLLRNPPCTHSRHRIGFGCADTELITLADGPTINPSDTTAVDRSTDGPAVPRQRQITGNQ